MGTLKRRSIISLANQGQKPPYLLFNILFFVLFTNFCCLAELPHFINYPNFPIFSVGLEVILAILLFLVGGTLVFLSCVYFKARINPILLGAFGLLSIFAVIGTFSVPESVEIPYGAHEVVTFTLENKFIYALSSVSGFFGLWIFFNFGPIGKRRRPYWFFFYEGIILFALISIFYSFATEGHIYQEIFSSHSMSGDTAPVSWAGQKNAFGRYILIGIIAELYLIYADRRYCRYVTIAFLSFCLLLTMAKTPIILGVALLWGFFIYMGILNFKKHRVAAIIHLSVAGTAVLAILILFLIPTDALGGLGSIIASIKNNAEIGGGGTIDTRVVIWGHAIEVWNLTGASRAFGFGDYAFGILMGPAMDMPTYNPTSHNAYLEMLGRGGITRLIIECLLVLYILYRFYKAFRAKRKDVILDAMVFVAILVHSVLESTYLFDCTCEALCLTGMCVIPLFQDEADKLIEPVERPNIKKAIGWPALYFIALLLPALTLFLFRIPILGLAIGLGIASLIGQGLLLWFAFPMQKRLYLLPSLVLGNLLTILLAFLFPYSAAFDAFGVFVFVWIITILSFMGPLLVLPLPIRKEFSGCEKLYTHFLSAQQVDE